MTLQLTVVDHEVCFVLAPESDWEESNAHEGAVGNEEPWNWRDEEEE